MIHLNFLIFLVALVGSWWVTDGNWAAVFFAVLAGVRVKKVHP